MEIEVLGMSREDFEALPFPALDEPHGYLHKECEIDGLLIWFEPIQSPNSKPSKKVVEEVTDGP